MRRALLTCLALTTLVTGLPTAVLGQQGEAALTLQVAPAPTTVDRGTPTTLTYTLVNAGNVPTLPDTKVLVRLPESIPCVVTDTRTNRVKDRPVVSDLLTSCVDTPATPTHPSLLSQRYAILTVPNPIAAADPTSNADEFQFTLSLKHPNEAMARTRYQIEAGILGYQYERNGQPVTVIPKDNRACRPTHPVDNPACTLAIADGYFPDEAGPHTADQLGTRVLNPASAQTHVLSSYTQADGQIALEFRKRGRPIAPELTPGDRVNIGVIWLPPAGPGGPHALYGTTTNGYTFLDLRIKNVDTTGFAAGTPTALPTRDQIKRAITWRVRPYFATHDAITIEVVSERELAIRIPFHQLPGRSFNFGLPSFKVQGDKPLEVEADLRFNPVTFVHPDYPNSPRYQGDPVHIQPASMHQRLVATLLTPPPTSNPHAPNPTEEDPTEPDPTEPDPTVPNPTPTGPTPPELIPPDPVDPEPSLPDQPTPPTPPSGIADPLVPAPAIPGPPGSDQPTLNPQPPVDLPSTPAVPDLTVPDPPTPTVGEADPVVPQPEGPDTGSQNPPIQGPDLDTDQDLPDRHDNPREGQHDNQPPASLPELPGSRFGPYDLPLQKERPTHLPAPPTPVLVPAPAVRGRLSVIQDPQTRASRWVESVVPEGQTVDTVLIGRDNIFADSLASGGLQGILNAPLLLNPVNELGQPTVASLNRLKPKQVVLLGGKAAVSLQTEAQLQAMGYRVTRLYGRTRIETAINAVATFAPNATHGILARAYGTVDGSASQAFADALSGGALAAQREQPLLLTPTEGLSESLRTYLANAKITHLTLLGSTEAISAQVEHELNHMGIATTRIAGENRADTAVHVANAMGYWHAGESEAALVVNGNGEDAWTDAFPAALYAKRHNLPVVLSTSTKLQPESARWLGPGELREPPTRVICGYSTGPLVQCDYVPAPATP